LKYWEIIADSLARSGWSYGYVRYLDDEGRQMYSADAHREGIGHFVVRADDLLAAFLELRKECRAATITLN